MSLSVFDMFSIGIGPSSSHTVGPMKAAWMFLETLENEGILHQVKKVQVDLYGSLALTGKGHATDVALQLGLLGYQPHNVDPDRVERYIAEIAAQRKLLLSKKHEIDFDPENDLRFHYDKFLPYHPNGMRFRAYGSKELKKMTYYSVGGGFIVSQHMARENETFVEEIEVPYPFSNAKELFSHCEREGKSLVEIVRCNELFFRSDEETDQKAMEIWNIMDASIKRGMRTSGILPGGLGVKRRAPGLLANINHKEQLGQIVDVIDYVSLWALAVNEENAAAGRVVTAPTNGSCGTLPAVLKYYLEISGAGSKEGVITFLLVAGVVGVLYKLGASISAAEMGCMGEVGVACSMAAAGLTAALGGTDLQIENASEIGMEHHLGLTCDPIKGLVQVPCIERNTMGALRAINASRLALSQSHGGIVSLDHVIATMRETGRNMQSMYKETSLGGLAVNVPEC